MSQPAPLFILAPPRSFTSVICGMIGQHPQMLGLPEVNLFAADNYAGLNEGIYKLRPGFRHGLLRAIAQIGLGEQSAQNVDAAFGYLEDNRELSSGDVFKDLVAWADPKRLVDKSPIYVYTEAPLRRIAEAFPDAAFLHLTRHPRGTCESVFKLREKVQGAMARFRGGAGGAGANPPMMRSAPNNRLAEVEDPDSMWLAPHKRILAFLSQIPPERRRWYRGEDFMAAPEEHLREVARWLDVDDSDEAIGEMMHPEHSPFACLGPPNARFGNDPSFMESPVLRPYTPPDISLDGPLAGGDDVELSDALKDVARGFGYS
ncbi:MAG: sulfotransferase [Pseudomonadota bacterium]